jgi:hypothetical protein
MVLDSNQLGGMADEVDGAPGYAVSDLAVQVKSIRLDGPGRLRPAGSSQDGPGGPGAGCRYEDQFIENAVEGDHLDKLVRAGYVEKVSGAKANAAEGDSSKASSKS